MCVSDTLSKCANSEPHRATPEQRPIMLLSLPWLQSSLNWASRKQTRKAQKWLRSLEIDLRVIHLQRLVFVTQTECTKYRMEHKRQSLRDLDRFRVYYAASNCPL